MADITAEWLEFVTPRRTSSSHKFLNGYLTAIVGSPSYPGAARLSCHAAARVGAGGVQVLLPESLWPLIGSLPPEIMPVLMKEYNTDYRTKVMPLVSPIISFFTKNDNYEISGISAFETFWKASIRSKAVLIGCGLGRSPGVQELIKSILSHTQLPCVVDGDALFALGKWGRDFISRYAKGQWILTPHRGELNRLRKDLGYEDNLDEAGINTSDISQMAKDLGVTIVAKGFPSLIFTPPGDIHLNNTGNPAATTAGCGDVLAGIIAGYLAQGVPPVKAARIGLHRAGQAADAFIERTGAHSLMASDIIEELGKL